MVESDIQHVFKPQIHSQTNTDINIETTNLKFENLKVTMPQETHRIIMSVMQTEVL